ncbi:DUF6777 domain-containing protein [Actinomycetospora succinea]|nr:DUF6777 domain-containing protein [Actinomycetospora succinea]
MTRTLGTPSDRFAAVPPPTRPVPPPVSPPPRRFLRTLGAAAVALAVAGGVAGVVDGLGPAGPENRYQPVSYAGDNPFASPVGTDRPGVAPVAGAGGEQDGDTPEMYAADPSAPSCDAAMLLSELQADPARAAVWAQVQRVAPDRIPEFVQGLSPVVLRTETAVVDHGYRDGRSVATPSVLAPGTAVFVNSYGQPVVKCFSGNPLTPGTSSDPAVTRVRPAAAPIATYAFHDPVARGPVAQPGKPDTTGSGPTPVPVEADGGSGGAPIPVEPDGGTGGAPGAPGTPGPAGPAGPGTGTPDPVTQGPSQIPVTGSYNYDGSIMLSDGRLQTVDGRVVTLPQRGPDTTGLVDGGWRDKDGLHYNRDGSRRDLMPVYGIEGVVNFFLTPEGRMLLSDGQEVPLPANVGVIRHYDGSVTYFERGVGPRGSVFMTTSPDGQHGDAVIGEYLHGILTTPDGKIVNWNGTERLPGVDIPGGGVVTPTGGTIPPAPAPVPGQNGQPLPQDGGGVVGPRTTPVTPVVPADPADPAVEPAPGENGGVVGPPVESGSGTGSDAGSGTETPARGADTPIAGTTTSG